MAISRAAVSQQISKPGRKVGGRKRNSTGSVSPRGTGQKANLKTDRNQSGHNRLY